MDQQRFYIASDYELMIDNFKNELNFLKSSWQNVLGRPLVVFTFRHIHLGRTVKYFRSASLLLSVIIITIIASVFDFLPASNVLRAIITLLFGSLLSDVVMWS